MFETRRLHSLVAFLISMTNDDDKRLGKYLLKSKLGQGGMGTVYLAMDTRLRREVALKVLPREFSKDVDAVKRFLREGQAAARLNHPNVVAIYDVDQQRGHTFLVMELVNAGSAYDLIKSGYLTWHEATRIIADACRGLVAAHAAGLIHRDIKPSNILLGKDGSVKLSDFGLVKVVDKDQPRNPLTRSGAVLGTPDFMSPEQCQGEKLDERSDLYSLGATYFALLTRRPPFPEEKPLQSMFAHCSKPIPDPRSIIADLPSACVEIVMKSLQKKRSDRFASATEFLAALQCLLDNELPEGRSMSAHPNQTAPLTSLGVSGDSLLGRETPTLTESLGISTESDEVAGATKEFIPSPLTVRDQFASTVMRLRHLSQQRWFWPVMMSGAVSLGSLLVWSGRNADSNNSDVSTKPDANPQKLAVIGNQADGGRAADGVLIRSGETLRETEMIRSIAASPDESLVYRTQIDGRVTAINVATRDVVREFKGLTRAARAVATSPNGKWLAAGSDDHSLWIWDAKTSAVIATIKDSASEVSALAFSPDSQRLAVGCYGEARLYAIAADGSAKVLKVLGNSSASPICYMVMSAKFSPDGRLLAVTSWDAKQVIVWNGLNGELIGNYSGLPQDPFTLQFLTDAKLLVGCGGGQLVLWDQPGRSKIVKLLPKSKLGDLRTMSLLPDGRTLVTAGEWDGAMHIVDLETGELIQRLGNNTQSNASALLVLPKTRKLILAGGADSEHKGFLQVWDIVDAAHSP